MAWPRPRGGGRTATTRSAPAVSASRQRLVETRGVGHQVVAEVEDPGLQPGSLEPGEQLIGTAAVVGEDDGRRGE